MAVESVEIVLNGVDNASGTIEKVNNKLVSSEEKYISKLKEQLIALREGADAAERFKLAEMGFSEETINAAVALKQQIEAAKEAARAQDELEKQTREAAEAQKEQSANTGSGPTMGESAQEFANAMTEGMNRARGIAEATKPIVEYLTGSAGWQMKMNKLMEEHQKQVDFNLKKRQEDFDVQVQIANLQTDEQSRREMLLDLQSQVTQELQSQQALVDQMNQTQQETADSFGGRTNALAESVTGGLYNNNEDQQIVENILEEENKRLAALQQQKEQLDQQLATENEQLRIARQRYEVEQQRAAASKSAEEELNRMRAEIRDISNPGENERRRVDELFNAAGVTDAQRMELENLQAIRREAEERFRVEQEGRDEMRAAIEETRQAEKDAYAEFRKAAEDAVKDLEDRQKKEGDYINALKIRNEEIKNGKRAAEEMKAAMDGMSEETIRQGRAIAIQNELLEAQKDLAEEQKKEEEDRQKKMAEPTPQLQAVQSRILTRGSNEPAQRAAKANERVAKLTERIQQLQEDHAQALRDIAKNTAQQAEVYGGR